MPSSMVPDRLLVCHPIWYRTVCWCVIQYGTGQTVGVPSSMVPDSLLVCHPVWYRTVCWCVSNKVSTASSSMCKVEDLSVTNYQLQHAPCRHTRHVADLPSPGPTEASTC